MTPWKYYPHPYKESSKVCKQYAPMRTQKKRIESVKRHASYYLTQPAWLMCEKQGKIDWIDANLYHNHINILVNAQREWIYRRVCMHTISTIWLAARVWKCISISLLQWREIGLSKWKSPIRSQHMIWIFHQTSQHIIRISHQTSQHINIKTPEWCFTEIRLNRIQTDLP